MLKQNKTQNIKTTKNKNTQKNKEFTGGSSQGLGVDSRNAAEDKEDLLSREVELAQDHPRSMDQAPAPVLAGGGA